MPDNWSGTPLEGRDSLSVHSIYWETIPQRKISAKKENLYALPSFSSKRGHVTGKHVQSGCIRDKFGNRKANFCE